MAIKEHWDQMYEMPADKIPWEIAKPPRELVEVLKSGKVPPGKALDVGCGTGNYSIYLASHGFDVTGVDFSENAIETAKKRAGEKGLKIRFLLADVLKLTEVLSERFDFIFDYSLLHHIADQNLQNYAAQFNQLLEPDGKLLLVCYSDQDEDAKGRRSVTGKYGNKMYYRPADEIKALYDYLYLIYYKEARLGKRSQHIGHHFLFKKSLS